MVPPSELPPLLASRYRLERLLAQGGMAEVWLATDVALSRQVAIKLLKPQLATDAIAAERFRREAVAVAGLAHPNIVAVYDVVDYDNQQAVVMQYVPGRSLREALDADRQMSVEMTMRIGAAVASALDAAHTAGIVHRDVKPGNILITPDNLVLLTDFGIAKMSDGGEDLTSENVMMGTAKYLSPEQVRGRKLDGRADLYSLGLVLYECLAGRVPFRGQSDADTALARLQRDPTPLGRLRPTLPAGLTALIHRLLARDPADRPATGAQVREAIERMRLDDADPVVRGPRPARPFDDATTTVADRSRIPGAPTPPKGVPVRPATPSAGIPIRRHNPGKLQQRWTPSLVFVGGLLLAAAAAAIVLWATLSKSDDTGTTPRTTKAAATSVPSSGSVPTATTPEPSGPVEVSSVSTFDPRGDNQENDDQVDNAHDDDPATAWRTECYQNQYFGAKQGVGVIVKLSGAARGQLTIDLVSAPWNLDVYVADSPADTVEGWGSPVEQDASQKATQATFDLDSDGRYLLLMLREVARDDACSSARPFRGGFQEISFASP